jgi:hypothetical protein
VTLQISNTFCHKLTIVPVIQLIQADENESAFAVFYSELRKESLESEQEDVTEDEARELFHLMKDEYNEMIVMTPEELGLENYPGIGQQTLPATPKNDTTASDVVPDEDSSRSSDTFNSEEKAPEFVAQLPFAKSNTNVDIPDELVLVKSAEMPRRSVPQPFDVTNEKFWNVTNEKFWSDTVAAQGISTYGPSVQTVTIEPLYENVTEVDTQNVHREEFTPVNVVNESIQDHSVPNNGNVESTAFDEGLQQQFEIIYDDKTKEEYRLERLRELLPNFTDRRLVKIIRCYKRSLGDPSLLELVPIVRENMPDYITSTWLKQMAMLTAEFIIQSAAQKRVVNTEILNSVLELKTASGSIDRAIDFHQSEFGLHNLEPTEFSDRLVIQMLLKCSRFNRALAFKQTVERSGRSLDVKSYGSLLEFCSRRRQLGSAILLLKECLLIHGAPPSEASLTNLRLLCRQAGIEDEIGLESLIGKDPVEWLRHGERELKREYSKKGRRDVQLSRNMLVRI